MVTALSRTDADGLRRTEALLHVPGCEGGEPPVAVVPLHGGTTNMTFRVATRLGTFVLRLNSSESVALGIDREREAVLHTAAARAGLAPATVYADPRGRFLITEYVDGEPWRAQDMADPKRLRRLAALLRQLHALPAPAVATVDPGELLRAHAERIFSGSAADVADRGFIEAHLHRAEAILRDRDARTPCIVHNDLYHANLIGAGQRLYLVDWEYAAVADPLFDLACLGAYYPEAAQYAPVLLEESGLDGPACAGRLRDLTSLFVLLSYLWYRTRRLLAAPGAQDLEAERALFARLAAP